ncbi:ArsR family transcriptional regulator [Hasllibacter halocynthiae]|uniref:ArsR family transcriptional regulator n=1 Tax=Hasllibacter halocynthiae TaxID=595589 RepID=A0A2T0X6U6_9RHOB|nr:metalloregulator ArsR/SmtB family transcription factor [Hasllibacter halocynthiae]PRY94659.1 ArsR family transcriptional regulator [Hasllibacter halocynthiae]
MDSVFKALADPSRRLLLDALRREDGQTLSQLEAGLAMSRFGVAKHLKALEAAGLVTRVRRGRLIHHYLNAVPLAEALERWIEPFRVAPAVGAILDLKARLETDMYPAPDFVLRTYIRCSQNALWDALTDAGTYDKWNFLGQSAARNGGLVIYRTPDGTETLHARDVEVTPKTRLVTTFEPKWEEGAKTSQVIYDIEIEGEFCKLTVTHTGLQHHHSEGTADGWTRSLAGLKTWLETGEAANFGGDHLWEAEASAPWSPTTST